MKHQHPAVSALLGISVADAVGVPYEFKSDYEMQQNPATDMRGYGTYNQPPGTWSDDSSLTFCLAESLLNGYDLEDTAKLFIRWRDEAYWTAHDELFDIGTTTNASISELKEILKSKQGNLLYGLKALATEQDNGNGALMRIMPLLFYIKGKNIREQFKLVWESAALTHKHIRSALACLLYLKLAEYLLSGEEKNKAYDLMRKYILDFFNDNDEISDYEQAKFTKIIQNDIRDLDYKDLKSGGYVMESAEASLWCFLKTDNYKESVLKAVNLGHDTDTTAAITGGLSGLYYGEKNIPLAWREQLARKDDIRRLGEKLEAKYL